MLDATGRSAVTADRVLRPKRPIVCRTFTYATVSSDELARFAIAAGPEGYAYRLGNGLHATLGVVGHGRLLRGHAREVVEEVRAFAPGSSPASIPTVSRAAARELPRCNGARRRLKARI